jgi:hypothetical protein
MTIDASFDVEIIEEVFDITIEDQQLLNVDLIVIDQIPGRPTSLTALGDVLITNPTNNQGLLFDETEGKWINKTIVSIPDPASFVQGETPTPLPPVLLTEKFTTAHHFISGSLEIFLNGLKLLSSDYIIYNDHQFSILIDTDSEDNITVNYRKEY